MAVCLLGPEEQSRHRERDKCILEIGRHENNFAQAAAEFSEFSKEFLLLSAHTRERHTRPVFDVWWSWGWWWALESESEPRPQLTKLKPGCCGWKYTLFSAGKKMGLRSSHSTRTEEEQPALIYKSGLPVHSHNLNLIAVSEQPTRILCTMHTQRTLLK